MEAKTHRPRWKTLLAFAIIYFVWGSTFLAIRVGALDRDWGSGSADEPLLEPRRDADRQGRCRGANHCIDELVGIVCAYAQAAASAVQSHELGGADARRRSVAGSHGGGAGRIS